MSERIQVTSSGGVSTFGLLFVVLTVTASDIANIGRPSGLAALYVGGAGRPVEGFDETFTFGAPVL
jgi:hypothetical protein